MLTRGDVQRVVHALIEQEWFYWKTHKEEWIEQCTDRTFVWDGLHWHRVRCLAQTQCWDDLKHYIDWMGETYLREQTQTLIQYHSQRLYQQLWGEHENV